MRVVLATVVLVFLSSNAALGGIGLGFCTSFEQNSGDWTFDNNLGLEFDVGVDIDLKGPRPGQAVVLVAVLWGGT